MDEEEKLPNVYRAADLHPEHIVEALKFGKGIIGSAIKFLQSKYGIRICRQQFNRHMSDWELHPFASDLRKASVEGCLERTIAKGIDEGDNQCMFYILNRWGHHAEFLDEKPVNPESEAHAAWGKIMRQTLESATKQKSEKDKKSSKTK